MENENRRSSFFNSSDEVKNRYKNTSSIRRLTTQFDHQLSINDSSSIPTPELSKK